MTDLNLEELKSARANGKRPEAPMANLRGVDLHRADLHEAGLREADLYGADLSGADLHRANLYAANLCGANLYGSDLRWANLRGANLLGADLRGANLCDQPHIFQMRGIKSGEAIYYPTPTGWHLSVGCWSGTLDSLRELISTNEGWPEAEGEECDDRRIDLEMLIRLCQRHADRWPLIISDLAEKLGIIGEDDTE